MGKTDNGGQAFPRAGAQTNAGWSRPTDGMTLRDWFAGQALAGMLAESMHDCGPLGVAHDAYGYADAMLKARKGGTGDG